MSALVSLVMAAWQPRRDWFRDAVLSALDQEDCDHELVVVDDGSPRPVEELLDGIGDPRLRVVRVEHGGESHARNAGIEAARGELIRFVDADDLLMPQSTAGLLCLVGGDDDTIGYSATLVCDEVLRPLWKMTCALQGEVLEECLLGRFTVRVPSLLFPRRVVEAAGPWDTGFRVSQDWDFVLRALEHARVRGDRAVASIYRRHETSATADLAAGELGGRRVVERYFERHPELRRSGLAERAEARLEARAGRARLVRGRMLSSARRLGRATRLDPGALAQEVEQSLPVVAGFLRRPAARHYAPTARRSSSRSRER